MMERVVQLARFCAVGLLCFAVGAATLTALCELAGMHYLLAFAASFVISNCLGYFLNGRYTFATRIDHAGGSRYLLINAALLAVNSLLLSVLVEELHIWYLGGAFILSAVNTPLSFVVHRLVSYRLGRRNAAPKPGAADGA